MGAASAREREHRSVRRPRNAGRAAARVDEARRGLRGGEIDAPDLSARYPRNALTFRRCHDAASRSKPLRRSAGGRHGEHGLFGAVLQLRGIGRFTLTIGAVAAHVDDRLRVAREARLGNPQPVVAGVVRHRAPLVIGAAGHRTGAGRRVRDQDVVHAAVARHPRDRAAGRRGDQVGRKRRRHQGVDRHRLPGLRCDGDDSDRRKRQDEARRWSS